MATLSSNDRADVWAKFMRQERISVQLLTAVTGLTKAQLRTAVDDIDTWVDANSASFNTAIQQPARSALTSAQKAALLVYVVLKRYESGV